MTSHNDLFAATLNRHAAADDLYGGLVGDGGRIYGYVIPQQRDCCGIDLHGNRLLIFAVTIPVKRKVVVELLVTCDGIVEEALVDNAPQLNVVNIGRIIGIL